MDNVVLVGVVVVLLAVAFVVLVLRLRAGRDRQLVIVGQDLTNSSGRPRPPSNPAPPEQRPAGRPRLMPRRQRRRSGGGEQPAQGGRLVLSGSAVVKEPRLAHPVVLAGTWLHSVYHGNRDRIAVRAATIRGSAHVHEGKPGQDAAAVAWCDRRGSLFAVVADGLGSRPDSGEVAIELVTDLTYRAAELRGDSADELVDAVIETVRRTVNGKGLDGSTTVVVAEVKPGGSGAQVTVWGIGDSEAWLLRDGRWHPVHQERRDDGENVTRHVPGYVDTRTCTVPARKGDVLVLGSDGFTGALAGRRTPLGDELAARWVEPPDPVTFLSHVDFVHHYFYDDRSVVAVWIR